VRVYSPIVGGRKALSAAVGRSLADEKVQMLVEGGPFHGLNAFYFGPDRDPCGRGVVTATLVAVIRETV
jgi:hypothetical protein